MADLAQNLVTQYETNVYQMAQQKGSKLSRLCTLRPMKGERAALNRVGATEAVQTSGKFEESPVIATPTDLRSLFGYFYHWGDFVDYKDDEETLLDPTGPVTRAGYMALGRSMDRVIIERGIFGPAFEGKDGHTQVPFPEKQIVDVTAGSADGKNTGLTLEKLRQARSLIGKADIDIDDPSEKMYLVYTQSQLDDLLRITEVTSSDYNAVKALVDGVVNKFMGFEFIRISSKLLPGVKVDEDDDDSPVIRKPFAFVGSCVAFANPVPITSRIAERADRSFNWYAYMKMKCGATRLEDGGVVQLPCLEA